MVAIITLTNQE